MTCLMCNEEELPDDNLCEEHRKKLDQLKGIIKDKGM